MKKRMGRPPTRAGMVSGVRVPMFGPERDLLKAAAAAAGVSLAQWCRESLVTVAHQKLKVVGGCRG